MKLRNWHIDGFGVFHDAALPAPGLGDGFNLFVGPNEAGKSTLLDFLHYTLFDYPRKGPKPRHEPLFGGRHGGVLTYEHKDEVCRLCRTAAKSNSFQLIGPDNAVLTESDLSVHLAHLPPEVFRNIFAFSLSELQTVDSLQGGDVRDLIFAASIGGSAARVREVQDALQKQADRLFREGAKGSGQNPPRLNRLIWELGQINESLREARNASEAVAGKVQLLLEKRAKLKAADEQLASLDRELARLQRLMSGWQPWVERCAAEQNKAALGDVSRFPANARVAWTELKAQLEASRSRVRQAREEAADLRQQLQSLPEQFPLLTHAARARELKEGSTGYNVAVQLAQDADNKRHGANEQLLHLSEELGLDWPEEVLRKFDVSLLNEDQARTRARNFETARESLREKRNATAASAREARALSRRCASQADDVRALEQAGAIPNEAELSAGRNQLAQLRQALHERETLRNQAENAANHRAQVALLLHRKDPPATQGPIWLRTWLWGGGAVLLLALCFFLLRGEKPAAAVSAAAAVSFIALAIALYRKPVAAPAAAPELTEAEERERRARQKFEAHETTWRSQAEAAGLKWPATEEDLSQREALLSQQERRRERRAALSEDLITLRNGKRQKHLDLSHAIRELRTAKRASTAAAEAWTAFLQERRLPAAIQPETAFGIFAKVKQARLALIDREAFTESAREHHSRAEAYLTALRQFLNDAGFGLESGGAARLFAGLEEVIKEIETQVRQKSVREDLSRRLMAAERQLEPTHPVKKAEDEALDVQAAFLRQVGVADEAGFNELAERAERHQQLTHTIAGCDQALSVIFGQGGAPDELRAAWANGSTPDWEATRNQRESELKGASTARDTLLQEINTLEIEIKQQAGSDTIADLQLEAEALREEVRKSLDEWLELAAALELLARTRESFERQNQNPALEVASRLFRTITGGLYDRIVLSLDSNELKILPPSGPAKMVTELSRGTLEQLYLCIRLGYIRHCQQQQGLALPLLMDDVAVNFDAARMLRTLQVLLELCAQGQQVLFFTCHEQLRELLPADARSSIFRIENYLFKMEPEPGLWPERGQTVAKEFDK